MPSAVTLSIAYLSSSATVFAIVVSLSKISKVYYFVIKKEELARIYKALSKGASKQVCHK